MASVIKSVGVPATATGLDTNLRRFATGKFKPSPFPNENGPHEEPVLRLATGAGADWQLTVLGYNDGDYSKRRALFDSGGAGWPWSLMRLRQCYCVLAP